MEIEIRYFLEGDERSILDIYKRAFAGFPWFEDLSTDEVIRRWATDKNRSGFGCLEQLIKKQ